jgi:hypothetical protein
MPEFILDHGSPDGARAYRALDSFTQGYVQAMFFTDCEHGTVHGIDQDDTRECVWKPEEHSSLPGDVTFADLAPETLARIIKDCTAFQETNAALLEAAQGLPAGSPGLRYASIPLDDERLGMLFWYARNGHGVAFTDDVDAPCLEALQKACGWRTAFPEVNSELGDDGLIYLM